VTRESAAMFVVQARRAVVSVRETILAFVIEIVGAGPSSSSPSSSSVVVELPPA